jgi:hypothetical protein
VATETDAARDRVIAARADLGAQVDILGASTRSALDFPAKIKRSPAKAAAVAGGVGFLALKGPQRLFGAAKRTIRGKPAPLPKSMLPDEIEATLRALGSDGDKVRGALERDFAAYAQKSAKANASQRRAVLLSMATPFAARAAKTAADALFRPDATTMAERMAEIRERAEHEIAKARDASAKAKAADDDATSAGA